MVVAFFLQAARGAPLSHKNLRLRSDNAAWFDGIMHRVCNVTATIASTLCLLIVRPANCRVPAKCNFLTVSVHARSTSALTPTESALIRLASSTHRG
jgi:hypothetical protein